MRYICLCLLLICLPSNTLAQEVLLEEGFEPGFDGTGWQYGNGAATWSLASVPVLTGSSAIELVGGSGGMGYAYDLGAQPTEGIYEVWFYDDLDQAKDTHVGVSGAADFLTSTRGHLLVGTDCNYGPNNYLVTEGWHSEGYFALGPPRTQGWHHVKIANTGGVNHCYLDGVLLHSTGFQANWDKVILMENNKCSDGKAWFDDLLVYELGAVPAKGSTWGTLKASY